MNSLCFRDLKSQKAHKKWPTEYYLCLICYQNKHMFNMIKLENWTIEELTGYKPMTTFYLDFSIADKFGVAAIQDTYDRAFNEWKSNYKYITEFVMVLNWKIWRWYQVNDEYSKLYDKLWKEADAWCIENLTGEALDYYFETTD